MSATTMVCTTQIGTQPMMPGGARLYERQAQIRTVVRRRLGERHAQLLAEAQIRPDDDRVTWLSASSGLVRPLSSLPAAVRDSVREECDALLADIERVGATLEDGGTNDGQLAGKLLRLAAKRPSDDHLFLVGNQPVVVCWGRAGAEAGAMSPTRPAAPTSVNRALSAPTGLAAPAPAAAGPALSGSTPAGGPPRVDAVASATPAPRWLTPARAPAGHV